MLGKNEFNQSILTSLEELKYIHSYTQAHAVPSYDNNTC